MTSMCNHLCQEFMSDIYNVTRSAEDKDDPTARECYLLKGRGWVLLHVIYKSGVQGLTGGIDFSNLLVSLLPWCLKFSSTTETDTHKLSAFKPISSCFQPLYKLSKWQNCMKQSKKGIPSPRKSQLHKDETLHRKKLVRTTLISEESSNSEGNASDTALSPSRFRRSESQGDFDDSRESFIYQNNNSNSDEHENNSVSGVMSSFKKKTRSTTPFKLCTLILDVLSDLCLLDLDQNSQMKFISPSILPHLLRVISSLYSSNDTTDPAVANWKYEHQITFQRQLIHLIITASGIVATQQNSVHVLISNKTIPILLEAALKLSKSKEIVDIIDDKSEDRSVSSESSANEKLILTDIVLGLVLCLDISFQCLPFNPLFIKNYMSLVQEFYAGCGFQLLQTIIQWHDVSKFESSNTQPQWLNDEPIAVIGSYLDTLKVVKVNYLHTMKCVRQKHQKCQYSHYLDHHHDILGIVATQFDKNDANFTNRNVRQTKCLVASWTEFLLHMLPLLRSKYLQLELFKNLYLFGVCCCMLPNGLIETVITCLPLFSPDVQCYTLDILNRLLLEQFSGGDVCAVERDDTNTISCQTCRNVEEKIKADFKPQITSSDLNEMSKISCLLRSPKWRSLQEFQCLLFCDNAFAVNVAKQLLELAMKGKAEVKEELFFSIYMYTLGSFLCPSSHFLSSSSEDERNAGVKSLSYSVQVYCLSALPYVLQCDCAMESFLTKKGILQMCELLDDEQLRTPVLRIFEALVTLDEERVYTRKIQQERKIQYEGGMVIKDFIDALAKKTLSNRNDSNLLQGHVLHSRNSMCEQMRKLTNLDELFAPKNMSILVDLWETCARLCLNSSVFVSMFQDSACYCAMENTLIQVFHNLPTNKMDIPGIVTEDSGQETSLKPGNSFTCLDVFFLKLSLLEALLIVCSTCYGQMAKKGDIEAHLWIKIKESFNLCAKMESTRLRALFDKLIDASMPHRDTILQYSHTRNISLDDELDVRELLQLGSEDENESLSTQYGYDADCDSTSDDLRLEHTLTTFTTQDSMMQRTYFPSVFHLMIDLLIYCQKTQSGQLILQDVLLKLLQTLSADRNAVKAMCGEGLLNVLLTGFGDLLLVDSEDNTARDLLLSIVQLMAQHQLSSCELQKVLKLFHVSSIPHDILLSTMLSIVENSQPEPYHSLLYPTSRTDRNKPLFTPVGSTTQNISLETSTHTSVASSSLANTRQSYSHQDVWKLTALKIPLKESLSWPPFENGFSVFIWFKVSDRQSRGYNYRGLANSRSIFNASFDGLDTKSSLLSSLQRGRQRETTHSSVADCLHLFSIGTPEKLFEVWTDPSNGGIICRLTSSLSETEPILCELIWNGAVIPNKWHHLALSYLESSDVSTLVGKTKMVLDGCQSHELIMDYPASSVRLSQKPQQRGSYLCLGHVLDNPDDFVQGTWSFGSVMLCRGTKIEKENCFHLYALGPDCESISKCDCSELKTHYAPCLTKQTVMHLKRDNDVFVGITSVDLKDFRASLLLSYRAKSPNRVSLYTSLVSLQLADLFGPQQFNNRALLTQQPRVISVSGQGAHQKDVCLGLEKAVHESGGIEAILYLVAKVYEDCSDLPGKTIPKVDQEKLQARAIQLLFSAVHFTPQLSCDFININGTAMLNKVLTSSRSVVDVYILKALMDASTTETMFQVDRETGILGLRHNTEAVVRDVTIIENVVLNWRIWESSDVRIVALLFMALESLIRDNHPLQDFNLKQFQSVNLINKIFLIWQERIQDGLPPLPSSISQSIVNIVQSMMGYPPDFSLIIAICDFLLLAHTAANSYVNHSRGGFYFNSWWSTSVQTSLKQDFGWIIVSSIKSSTSATVTDVEEYQADFGDVETVKKSPMHALDAVSVPTAINTMELSSYPLLRFTSEQNRTIDAAIKEPVQKLTLPDSRLADFSNQSEIGHSRFPKTKVSSKIADKVNAKGHNVVKIHSSAVGVDREFSKEMPEPEDSGQDNFDEVFIIPSVPGKRVLPFPTVHDNEKRPHDELLRKERFVNISEYAESREHEAEDSVMFSGVHDSSSNDRQNCTGATSHKLPERFHDALSDKVSGNEDNLSKTRYGLTQADEARRVLESNSTSFTTGSVSLSDVESDEEKKPFMPALFDEEIEEKDRSLSVLCVGLLKLLTSVIGMMPDRMVEKSFGKVINPETFIVLAHSRSPDVRTAVIKVLEIYLIRAKDSHIESFKKIDGFHLLGMQLYQYPTHQQQVEAALSILQGRPFHFDKGLEIAVPDLSPIKEMSLVLVLAMLENSITDMVLCHNMLILLTNMFNASVIMTTLMLQAGIVETICNLIARIFKQDVQTTDTERVEEYHLILKDIQQFLCTIAVKEFSTSGSTFYQQFEDLLLLVKNLEQRMEFEHGPHSKQVQTLKTIQFNMIMRVLETIGKGSEDFNLSGVDKKNLSGSFTDSGCNDGDGSTDSGLTKSSGRFPFSIFSIGTKKRIPMVSQSQVDRLKKFLPFAVDLILFTDNLEVTRHTMERRLSLSSIEPTGVDKTFQRQLFDWTFRAFEMTLTMDKKNKNVVMWAAREITRSQFARQLVNLLSSNQDYDQRTYALRYIMNETQGYTVLKIALEMFTDLGRELSYLVYDLLQKWRPMLNSQHQEDGSRLINMLRQLSYQVLSPQKVLNTQQQLFLSQERQFIDNKRAKEKADWLKKKLSSEERILHRFDKLSSQITTHAMEVTQNVTNSQNKERQKFFNHIKRSMTESVRIKKSWQELVQNLTHERAVWFCPESYPRFWQLDPTEGPGRTFKRLQRSHWGTIIEKKKKEADNRMPEQKEELKNVDQQFLSEDFQYKMDSKYKDPPLIYLFKDDHLVSDSAALIYDLHRNEKIHHTCRCTTISPKIECEGELLLGENCMYFVVDETVKDANYTQVLIGNKEQLSLTWSYDDIREIHKRWFQLCDIGIEIFLTNGKTCLLAFTSTEERDNLNQYIGAKDLPNLIEMEKLSVIQQLWLDGRITNFEFLTHLNKMSGRSFNDLMQYPVFPFILRDYVSSVIDLRDSNIYRDLAKPIAVQQKSREAHYIENYEAIEKEMNNPETHPVNSILYMGPFHFGSHYSNSGSVLHFLVRMPPFTEIFLQYQDNSFDLPNRSYHSVDTSWRLASYESTSDVKELIPEFFFFPEFLRNYEGWDMGRRDDGNVVWDVKLPAWCKNDPRLFILIHRQALESDHVTKNIQSWIDLVFGYKQQGAAAVKALNVFHPATYFGIDVCDIKDDIKRKATETMVKTYGQTPKQLFRTPQPQNAAFMPRLPKLFHSGTTPTNSKYLLSPVATVSGVKWGQYVGSPDLPQPCMTWTNVYKTVVSSLVALPTGEVFGIGANSCLLAMYSKERAPTGVNSTDIVWAAILTWGHSDGILRVINQRDKPAINFLYHSPFDTVTCSASVPDCRLLFTGGTGGMITVYHTVFNQAKESDIQVLGQKCLFGHSDTINSIVVNKPYSVLVTASEDCTCIIWDLNRLSYVRSICSHSNGVEILAVSSTLGDIASVSSKGLGSCLQLHTINAQEVATYDCEDTINALTFSSAPEGRSVNVIAGGLSSGVVRLWSTWDLCHIRDLQHDSLSAKPVVSLVFTYDSQQLFISLVDGTVTLWEVPSSGKEKPPRFIPFLCS